MKAIINGEERELTPVILRSEDGEDEIIHLDQSENLYRLVKNTEKKEQHCLAFWPYSDITNDIASMDLDLTPTTAQKLSEAISALVEGVTRDDPIAVVAAEGRMKRKIREARESYQNE